MQGCRWISEFISNTEQWFAMQSSVGNWAETRDRDKKKYKNPLVKVLYVEIEYCKYDKV